MAGIGIEVNGLRELDINLRILEDRFAKKIARAALKKAGEPIREDVERRVWRAFGGPTYPSIGHAADHIIAKVGITKKAGPNVKIGPDKDHWYTAFQEFGTPFRAADPALRPALDSKRDEAVRILSAELGRRIAIEAAKIAK